MAADFGTDIGGYPDLDPSGSLVSGQTCLAQALARRLTTPRGTLYYDPSYGTDLRAFLNGGQTEADLFNARNAIERECELDERVRSASADVAYDPATSSIKVKLSVDTNDGPFSMGLVITSTTAKLLLPS